MMNHEPQAVPRGIRNNNPGNIMGSLDFAWQGQNRVDQDGYCVFKDPVYGMRAMCLIWMAYKERDHCVTLSDYISRWAPQEDNPTADYIRFVAGELHITPETELDLDRQCIALLRAVIQFENGEQPYSSAQLGHAVAMSHIR